MERGEHKLVHVFHIGKVPGCGSGEHFGHGFFKFGRDVIRIKTHIPVHIFPFPSPGTTGPFMGIGRVVHHEIQAQTNAPLTQFRCEFLQFFIGPNPRVHLAEIFYCITAIVFPFRHFQKGHQVQIGQLLFRQVIQLFHHTAQAAVKQVTVHGHTQHAPIQVPTRVLFPFQIQFFQITRAFFGKFLHRSNQFLITIAVIIQFHIKPAQFILMFF